MATAYHLRIRSSKGFAGFNFRELWDFRGLLAALAIRDIKLRYRQTALGVAWVVLQPLLASGILAFVFGTVAGIIKPGRSSVFIFVLCGFIGWSLFSATFIRSGNSLIQHSARFRDVQHITPVLLQLLFYASPVAYQAAAVPEKWRGLFLLNPLVPLFEGLRWSLLREGHFRGLEVAYSLFVSALTLVFGLLLFRRAEREFADVM